MKKLAAVLLGLTIISLQASGFQKKEMPYNNKVVLQIKASVLAAFPGFASFFGISALLRTCNISYSEKIAAASAIAITAVLQRGICKFVHEHFWVGDYNKLVDFLDEIENNPRLVENFEHIKKAEEALRSLIVWNLAGHGLAEQDRKDIVAIAEKIRTFL